MSSGSGDFQSPFGHLLPLDIGKIHRILQGLFQFQHFLGQGFQNLFPLEMIHNLPQIVRGIHGNPVHQFSFRGIAGRDEHGRQPFRPGPEDHGQDPVHRPQGSIQGQFSRKHRHGFRQVHVFFGRQHPQGDGQIQSGSVFFQVCRGQVDGNVGIGKPEAGVLHCRLHPLPGFFHRRIRKAHHFKSRHAVGHIYLHRNHFSVDASGGLPPGPCIHGISSFVVYRSS